jgi:hypothetical protein
MIVIGVVYVPLDPPGHSLDGERFVSSTCCLNFHYIERFLTRLNKQPFYTYCKLLTSYIYYL